MQRQGKILGVNPLSSLAEGEIKGKEFALARPLVPQIQSTIVVHRRPEGVWAVQFRDLVHLGNVLSFQTELK
jgi:hypothetical protein